MNKLKRAWQIIVGLCGIIIGLILGVLIDRDTVNKYFNKIHKVKVKGDNSNAAISIDQLKEELRNTKRERRLQRRAERKANKNYV